MNLSKEKPVDPDFKQYLDDMGSDTSLARVKDGPVFTQYFRSGNPQEGFHEHARVLFARRAKGSQSVVIGTLSSDDGLEAFQANIILTQSAIRDFVSELQKFLPAVEWKTERPANPPAGEEDES